MCVQRYNHIWKDDCAAFAHESFDAVKGLKLFAWPPECGAFSEESASLSSVRILKK